jgi:hypothetical protein
MVKKAGTPVGCVSVFVLGVVVSINVICAVNVFGGVEMLVCLFD